MLAVRGVIGASARPGLGLLPACALTRPPAIRDEQRGPKLVKRAKDLIRTWKIRKGDEVFVNAGKDKGSTGEVLMTDFRRNMLKVKGCNLRKLRDEEGNYTFIEKKIHYSNCALMDPVHRKPTCVGLMFTENGDAIRISKLSGRVIPWPDLPEDSQQEKIDHEEGPKDTSPEKALEKTYDFRADAEALRLARLTMTKYNLSR